MQLLKSNCKKLCYHFKQNKMRAKLILLFLSQSLFIYSFSQSVGIGTTTPDSSAMLDISSNNKGLLLPRIKDTSAIKNPAKGLLIYSNHDNTPWYYDGHQWQTVAPGVINTTPAPGPGKDSLWYRVQDSIVYTYYPYVHINTDPSLLPQQAALQVTGNLLIQGKLKYSNATPTAGQTYTMNNTSTQQNIPASDSVFRIYDPGGSGNYNNNMQGNVAVFPVLNSGVGVRVSSVAADFGIGSGDTLWIAYDVFPACRTDYAYFFTNTTVNPADFVTPSNNGAGIYFIFRSNADGINGKGFNFSVTRLYSSSVTGKIQTAGASLNFNSSTGAFAAGFSADVTNKGTALGANTRSSGSYATAMGYFTRASGSHSTATGYATKANGPYSTAIGYYTTADGQYATAMGINTIASGASSTTMGSGTNASGEYSTAMGYNTTATQINSTAMGNTTFAIGENSTAMGYNTIATKINSTAMGNSSIAMGDNSTAMGANTIAKGAYSTATGKYTEAAGYASTATGDSSKASGSFSFAGGFRSTASGNSAVAMGNIAIASGDNSIAMGGSTTASGNYSIAIGSSNTASGNYSTALGNFVSTNNQSGSFLIGDLSTISTMNATTTNNFRARFANGYRLYTSANYATSCALGAGDNAWTTGSDVRTKENFAEVNGEDFLKKISGFHLTSWNYKTQDPKIFRHYGPMAQDFHAAFGKDRYGTIGNDTTINSADFAGVSFIAIQALEKRTQRIGQLEKENTELKKQQYQQQAAIETLQKQIDELKLLINKLTLPAIVKDPPVSSKGL
jgi:hypothetical protein